MSTTNRDFKVKHGLNVAEGGTFGQAVTVGTPTQNGHATTKEYVDTVAGGAAVTVGSTAPASPSNGTLWLDTLTERIYVYYNSQWVAQATLNDAEFLQDHIHDTAIDGSGLIVSIFNDAGYYNEAGALIDSGYYNTSSWTETWDGGTAIDNFN